MKTCLVSVATIALGILAVCPAALQAAGHVRLELVGDARGAALDFQQWARVLGKAGIRDVRIRTAKPTDKVGIQKSGSDENPVYLVTGMIKSRSELLLPPGRFRPSDAGRLARWLDDLAKYGPEDPSRQQTPFGLPADEFERVRADMAQPVLFPTEGLSRGEAIEKIARRLRLPLKLDPGAAEALRRDEVGEELMGISSGTALAYVLRPMGYCLVPRRLGRQTVYAVTAAKPGLEIWPVGWEPEKSRKELVPAMFEFHNVNVQGVTATKVIEAIGKRLELPVLIDQNALARHGVEPEKVMISHPARRTTYGVALRKILFQARLKSEIRVDESGKPFLWISTVKPI